ncbi:hypothetical protein QBC44DRAFT_248022 [Cladorrhinum sp. PSN332]|nr:hypothetical protein QBC44DRAFT_248022 [Cladorrhinum sp. PSN332]
MKDVGGGGLEGLEESSRRVVVPVVPQLPNPVVKATCASPLKSTTNTTTTTNTTSSSKWNTKNLFLRLGADALSAASAAVLVAPIISIIDRSIMENASGRSPLLTSLRTSFLSLLRSPQTMITSRPFRLIFALYGGTYLTANTLDTFISTTSPQNLQATHVSSGASKFVASSAANIGLCIYKDAVFVRLFGTGPPRPVTLPSYLLFAARDCMTIFASFNVPPLLGPVLTERLGENAQKYVAGQTVAQFAAPAMVQVFSTPVHLLGLDIYNRQGRDIKWGDRWKAVKKNWGMSTAARICRIVPAFGVGGVVNVKARRAMMERLV